MAQLDFSAFGELVEAVNESNKPAPASENPDRQFYQSTVAGSDRQFEPEVYSVQAGDTLSRIAARNPFTLDQLKQANEGMDFDDIDIGQELNLPFMGTPTTDTTTMPDSDKPKIASAEPIKVQAVEEATTPQEVTEVVTESTPEIAADNPLEYIFNKGFVGLDEKNPEHQGTIAGFLNNAVPNFVTDNSQVTKGSKAWCGAFADHVLENLGFDRLETGDRYDKLRAKQYLGYGDQVDGVASAKAGDLVVIKGPTGWHVSFFVGKDKNGKVLALGGNQGNSVKVSAYSENSVRGVRRISNVGDMDVNMLKNISSDIAENSGEESTR